MFKRRCLASRKTAFAAAILACALSMPGRAAAVKDATGAIIEVSDDTRIVSIGGAITEILYALGSSDKIIAVDQTSLFPPQATEKPNVGYMRALSAEGVLGVNPSVIVAQEGSGPKETIAILAAAKVPMVIVPDRFTGEGVIDKIKIIAQVVGQPQRAACLIGRVEKNLDALSATRSAIKQPLRVMFILSLREGRAMVSGRDTAADGIIKLAGGVNAIQDYAGYKQINDEAIVAANPDVVLVMTRSSQSITADETFAQPAFSLTNAAKRRAFVAMDGLYLLGFGPRTADAARDLARTMYPDIAAIPSPTSLDDCGG